MQQYWIFVCITATIIVASSYAQDLRITVVPIRSSFSAADDVQVNLTYSNVGNDILFIHNWCLPTKSLIDPLFEITLNGNRARYTGPLVKRRAPKMDDVISLPSGKSVSIVIQVSPVYDMSESGNYIIQFIMNAGRVLFTSTNQLKPKIHSSVPTKRTILQSAPAGFFVEGRSNSHITNKGTPTRLVRQVATVYPNCTASEISNIVAGVQVAKSYAALALFYLRKRAPSGTARYKTWFGNFSSGGWDELTTRYNNIQDALVNKNVVLECECSLGTSTTFAYVMPDEPYYVHLCPTSLAASASGSDSLGGTIVHELSHFLVISGTLDNAYGSDDCQALALTDPDSALNNADSTEYFAENNPPLQ